MKSQRPSIMAGLVTALLSFAAFTAAQADTIYFPPGVWGEPGPGSSWTKEEMDFWYNEWFGGDLAQLRERPLWQERTSAAADLSIRYLKSYGAILPSKDVSRFAFFPDGTAIVTLKYEELCEIGKTKGCVGDEDGYGLRYVEEYGHVSQEDAKLILAAITHVAPFTTKIASIDERGGMDGTTSVLEFSDGKRFNAIQRWELNARDDRQLAGLTEALSVAIKRTTLVRKK